MQNNLLNKLLQVDPKEKKAKKNKFLSYPSFGLETKQFFFKINLLGSKKRLIFKTINIIGIIICFLSFFYMDMKIKNKNKKYENTILLTISILTLLYSILKFFSNIFHEYILKFEKIRLQSSPLIKKRFFLILILYLIHPNIITKNISLKIPWVSPHQKIEKTLNFIFIAIQNTIIFFEIFLRILIHSQISEKQKYKIRKKKSHQHSFPFFFKYLFLKDPIFVVKWLLILAGLELGMLLKISETNNFYDSYLTDWVEVFWTVFMIMVNSGYGDVFPVSYWGKIVSVLSGIIGYLIFSLVILGISNLLDFDCAEDKLVFIIDKDYCEGLEKRKAALVVTLFFKCSLEFRRGNLVRYHVLKERLDKEMKIFREVRRNFKNIKNLKNYRKIKS